MHLPAPDVVKQRPKGEARLDIEGKFDMGTGTLDCLVWVMMGK